MKKHYFLLRSFLITLFVILNTSLFSQGLPGITLEKFDLNKNYAKASEKVGIHYEISNKDSLASYVLLKIYLSQSPSSYIRLDLVKESKLTLNPTGSTEGIEEITLPDDIIVGMWFISFQVVTTENGRQVVEIENTDYSQLIVYEVTVYGTSVCGYTQEMKTNLEYYSIPYYFKDVKKNSAFNDEMWAKLKEIGYTELNTKFPVVDINNNVIIRPKIGKVRKFLKP